MGGLGALGALGSLGTFAAQFNGAILSAAHAARYRDEPRPGDFVEVRHGETWRHGVLLEVGEPPTVLHWTPAGEGWKMVQAELGAFLVGADEASLVYHEAVTGTLESPLARDVYGLQPAPEEATVAATLARAQAGLDADSNRLEGMTSEAVATWCATGLPDVPELAVLFVLARGASDGLRKARSEQAEASPDAQGESEPM